MKDFIKKFKLAATFSALSFLSTIGTAQATIFEIDFSNSGAFSGTAPSLPADLDSIYAKAIFDDHDGSGTVTLTMTILNNVLPTGAYIGGWYFNVGSAPLTSIVWDSGIKATVSNGIDAFKANGTGGKFDFEFEFPNKKADRLIEGGSSVYTLTGQDLTANSFNFLSVPAPNGGYYVSAIHLQGYGNSVWIAGDPALIQLPLDPASVPEPETIALLGLGLLGIAATRRRRQILS